MSEHYDFHYQPTGSGAISGQQVLEQTEDAINELGDYVNDNVGGAMDVAQEALETAQNAQNDAQTALDTANSFSDAIQSAQQDASTALSTAQTAQTTATNANATAIQAQQDASSAVTTANNASGQVSTLSGTVTALGQRVTTAEGNIGQNTSDITALTTRVGTAEGNITTLQNDVSIAQGNASSAMATAGTVKQQSYVLRYSSTALTASSTNSNALLDNTDNLKVGDKVIDSSGVIYSVTAIDTANSTFTIGTSLIDLAQDSDVVHKSGDETIGGQKTFDSNTYIYNSDNTAITPNLILKNQKVTKGSGTETGAQLLKFVDKNNSNVGELESVVISSGTSELRFRSNTLDSNNQNVQTGVTLISSTNGLKRFCPTINGDVSCGYSSLKWSGVYSTEYYYGANNTPFTDKFVTTDTAQTVSGSKTFSSNVNVYNSDNTADTPNLILKNEKQDRTTPPSSYGAQYLSFTDKNNSTLGFVNCGVTPSNVTQLVFRCYDKNGGNEGFSIRKSTLGTDIQPSTNNAVNLGTNNARWADVQTTKVNALEPSSLSLPSDRSARVDISSYITNLGNGDDNSYTVPANGYIWLHFTSINSALCFSQTSNGLTNYAQTFVRYQEDGQLYAFFPVRKDDVFVVQIYTSSTAVVQNAYFIPCQGNV